MGWERLLSNAVELIESCSCKEGCPNCIVTPRCGEYNHGLDKAAALKIGRALGFGNAPADLFSEAPPEAPTETSIANVVDTSGIDHTQFSANVAATSTTTIQPGVFSRRLVRPAAGGDIQHT